MVTNQTAVLQVDRERLVLPGKQFFRMFAVVGVDRRVRSDEDKALACIGELPPTLASRCIRVNLLRATGDRPQLQARLDANPGRWRNLRDDLHALALADAGEILRVASTPDPAIIGMNGREGELWRPPLALANLWECAGIKDLAGRVREHADRLISENLDDTSPDPDKVLVSLLASAVIAGQSDLTAKDLLKQAQDEDPITFAKWTPHRVASTLKRYGLLTHKTGRGRRSYHQVKVEQLRRVARAEKMFLPPVVQIPLVASGVVSGLCCTWHRSVRDSRLASEAIPTTTNDTTITHVLSSLCNRGDRI